MNRKTSTLLSLGLSAFLIAAAIWFLYDQSSGIWIGGGHMGMGYGHMTGGGMGFIMIIFWIVLIGALILLISGAVTAVHGIRAFRKDDDDMQTPAEILKQRYARGEIDKTEYKEKLKDLNQ